MLSPGSTTQGTRGGGPAHRSGSRASSLPSTALNTFAPSLPTHPPRPGPRRAISGDLARSRAISGPRRAISGDLALSRAISGPRRAISGDLGASLARRHTCSKKGRAWLEPRGSRGRARSVLAASPCATWAGEAAPRAARPSPRHADPCAHRSSSALLGLLLRSRRGTRRYSLPPTSDGSGRFCAPWRLCMSRVPACQG